MLLDIDNNILTGPSEEVTSLFLQWLYNTVSEPINSITSAWQILKADLTFPLEMISDLPFFVGTSVAIVIGWYTVQLLRSVV